jgi:hypothetical protein
MKDTNSDETFFREIMSKSKLKVPFSDFDDKIMSSIEKRHSNKPSISRDIKLSLAFFGIGSTFGILVSIILPGLQESFFGIPLDSFTLPFLVIFTFILVTQLNSLIDFYKSQKIKAKHFSGRG